MSEILERLRSGLAGRYEVESVLGEGGMAVVMLATDLKHRRKVAIKVLLPELSQNLGTDRFLQEIETAAGLSHPHILPVHDSGEADGLLYYVMPLVEGESLSDRIEREQQLPIDDALQIAREVGEALSYAHSLGIVHRDIKPDNIMLYGGHAVIADFGIAKAVSAAGGERLTGTGIAVGTPTYMSPEQGLGEDVDARSDIYALGCMVFEMLAGQPPYSGRNVQSIVRQHVTAPVPSVATIRPSVPPHVADAIARSMAKTPADRFSTALGFADALKGKATGTGAFLAVAMARKLPHAVGIYAVVAIGVFFLLEVLVGRLVWSPHLPAFGLTALLTLLPAVLAIVYQRRVSKIFVPTNLAISALVLWLGFGTKDLGAATTSIVVEDEDGNRVERVVPKSEFRKRFALFFFDNETGDPELDWMQYGIPLAVDLDLEQDMFVTTLTADAKMEDLRRAGYDDAVGLPLTLQRGLADEEHYPHFVTGSFSGDGEELTVNVRLYETRRGRLLAERAYTGSDPLTLADTISRQLRRDLDIPAQYIEDMEDLPAADLMTSSAESYRLLVEAYRELTLDEDWAAAKLAVQASVAADPTNAYAHLVHYVVSLFGNDQMGAAQALQGAMQHIYKLPERSQYMVKMAHYEFNREPEKQLAVAELRVEVFPDDIEGRALLAMLYSVRRNYDGVIGQYQAILDLDPTQLEYLQRLGSVYRAQGDFDEATAYFAQYAEQFPDDPDAYTALGRLNQLLGEFDEAKAQFERALIIKPNDISVQLSLAFLERRFGNFAGELDGLSALLPRSTTAQDSVRVLSGLRAAYNYRGQTNRAIDYMLQGWAVAASFTPPSSMLLQQLSALDEYVKAGQEDRARQTLATIGAQLAPPFDGLVPVGRLRMAVELEDPDEADAAIAGVQQFIDAYGAAMLNEVVLEGRARVFEMRGQYSEAIAAFETQLAEEPTSMGVYIDLGRCYRKAGDLDAAERALNKSLTAFPNSPTAHYQLALVAEQRGDIDRSVEHLERSMMAWAGADDAFRPAREAREKLAELRGAQ